MQMTASLDGLDLGEIHGMWLVDPDRIPGFGGGWREHVIVLRRSCGGPELRKFQTGELVMVRNGEKYVAVIACMEDIRPALDPDGTPSLPIRDSKLDPLEGRGQEYVIFVSRPWRM